MELRCYRKILHISYKDHVTNEEVHATIQQAIGPHEDLLTIVKRRKLQWYGHVSRSSGLVKTILQGTVKGGRRQGRQRKRWEDNIREWTGLEFGKSQRAVESRQNGENWLRSHPWCLNDPRGYEMEDDDDDDWTGTQRDWYSVGLGHNGTGIDRADLTESIHSMTSMPSQSSGSHPLG